MMATFVFANFFQTTLSAAVTTGATSISVASGTGAPTIAAGQQWAIVVQSAATPSVREIMYVTAVAGAAFTVVRGQEGTTALAWSAADNVFGGNTAGQMAAAFETATALGGALSGNLPNPTIANNVNLPGVPTAATASPGTNTTQLATTAFVIANAPSSTVGANPTAQVGNAVINGVATTFMRSDAAPPLSSGAAAVNVGTLGGVLTGTLPNPGMASGAAVANIGYTPYNATNPAGYITGNNLFTTITRYTSPTRSINATYTNSTGKPLQVVVSFPISSGVTATFSINGASAGYWSYNSSTGATQDTSFTAIIPNGSTYELSGPLSFNDWTEAV